MVPSPDLFLVAQLLESLMADLAVDIPICLPKFVSRVLQDFSYQQHVGSMISHVFCLAFPMEMLQRSTVSCGFLLVFFWQFRVGDFFPHGLTGQNVTDRIPGGGFRYVWFSPLFGEDVQFD